MEENKNNPDIHGTKSTTRWVHKHRTLAKWLARGLVAGATAVSYYLKKQEAKIEKEETKEKKNSG
jgi:hypothetical protein